MNADLNFPRLRRRQKARQTSRASKLYIKFASPAKNAPVEELLFLGEMQVEKYNQ
ncbi:MAG: hypothetical protein IKS19_01795 [Clostridia bacterium]|nr:hypothetical protein [Clostridia bacterium]